MRFLMIPAAVVALSGTSTVAVAQGSTDQCHALQEKAGEALGFVTYPGATEPLPTLEFNRAELASRGAMDFRVCFAVDPVRRGLRGAVNIKFQVYSPDAKAPNRSAQYENNTDGYASALAAFRRQHRRDAYPSVDIADYQDYHGCPPKPFVLDDQFHISVGDRRTNDGPYRAKFLFSKDVKPSCSLPAEVAEFVSGLPIGESRAVAASRGDLDMEKIVQRRSVILQYDFTRAQPGVQYVTYVFSGVGKGKCLRVEGSYVFDKSTTRSEVIGVACVVAPE